MSFSPKNPPFKCFQPDFIRLVRTVCIRTDLCADLILISEVNLIGRGGIVQLDWS